MLHPYIKTLTKWSCVSWSDGSNSKIHSAKPNDQLIEFNFVTTFLRGSSYGTLYGW